MIYMVACRFAEARDTNRLAEWNRYYDGPKLDTLLSLPGFLGSQRFCCTHETAAPYLALHSVRDAQVFDEHYAQNGGGGFEGWDGAIDNWSRDLFDGLDAAPAVGDDDYLVITDDPATAAALTGVEFAWLDSAGLDQSVRRRALAVLPSEDGEDLVDFRPAALRLYRPITQLRLPPGTS